VKVKVNAKVKELKMTYYHFVRFTWEVDEPRRGQPVQ
jgi:hypothetical protein